MGNEIKKNSSVEVPKEQYTVEKLAHDLSVLKERSERTEKMFEDFLNKQKENNKHLVDTGVESIDVDIPFKKDLTEWTTKDIKRYAPAYESDIKEFQALNDEVYLTASIMTAKQNGRCETRDENGNIKVSQDYTNNVKSLKSYNALLNLRRSLRGFNKALSSLSGYGGDWIPTNFSTQLTDKLRLEYVVANTFRQFQMPSNPYTKPIVSSDISAYYVPESTSDTSTSSPASTLNTTSKTYNAKKIKSRTYFSDEVNEDSIISLSQEIQNNMVIAHARAVERGIIHGTTESTHFDTGEPFSGSYDIRRMFDGLRKMQRDYTGTSAKASSSYGSSELADIISYLGKYGIRTKDNYIIVSKSSWFKVLRFTELITIDKYGPDATILTGEIGKLFGATVLVSDEIRDDMNTAGIYDGVTCTKTINLAYNSRAFDIGVRGGMDLRTEVDNNTDQIILSLRQRLDFKCYYDTTLEPVVSLLYNI